jgi:hypothetical protein
MEDTPVTYHKKHVPIHDKPCERADGDVATTNALTETVKKWIPDPGCIRKAIQVHLGFAMRGWGLAHACDIFLETSYEII